MPDGRGGPVILVTGSSGKMGTVLCEKLLDSGSSVLGLDSQPIASELRGHERYVHFQGSVSSNDCLEEVSAYMEGKYWLSGLANLAAHAVFSSYKDRTKEEFMTVIETNLWAPFLLSRGLERYMREGTSIVNVGSIYGLISSNPDLYTDTPRQNSEVYSASKAGLVALTKYLAVHMASKGVRVNAISPGGIQSSQGPEFTSRYSGRTPLQRLATYKEVVDVIVFLLSGESSYMTGSNVVVDGGFSIW